MNKINVFIAFLFIGGLFLTSCNKEEEKIVNENFGSVEGRIFAKNGDRYVPAVKVFVDVEGEVYLTTSDNKGRFSLDVPEGKHTLYMHAGDGSIFFNTTEITVQKKSKVVLDNSVTILNQNANLAYIEGSYDNIQSVVIDSLGYSADQISTQDLLDLNTMSQYAAIFLNCGLQDQLEEQMYLNLEQYLANGGNLYASDFAVAYLTGDGNFDMEPPVHHEDPEMFVYNKTCTTPLGGFIAAQILCTQKQGAAQMLNNVDVVSADIQNVLGSNVMDINYNLGAWEVIENLGPEFDVLIHDNSTNNYGPLAVRSNANAPWVGQGNQNGNNGNNGNNNNFVTICHIPPGNPNNPQTITISNNALQAHLNHGCTVGACSSNGTGAGQVIYTTFHNYTQGTVSQDTYDILQYFIMNL